MSDLRDVDLGEVLAAAEGALSVEPGGAVTLGEAQVLGDGQRRNLILRARAIAGDGSVRSVIIKATRSPTYDPDAETVLQTSGLAREWVASAYLGARAPGAGHGAALLAAARQQGVLVFEDLGADLGSLVGPLLNGDATEAERALIAYARALGRLHADAAGRRETYVETFESIFGAWRARRPAANRIERQALDVATKLGGDLPAEELAEIARRLCDPGAWLALVHGDPCPDNALVVADRVRLIDFEFAEPSHALLDAAYWRMGFPTCWCAGRLPQGVVERVEAVYRAEIATAMPLAGNDAAYRAELAFAAAIWLFVCLDRRLETALREDARWGIASVRSRLLLYLEVMVELVGAAGVLPGIARTAEAWRRDLGARWPETATLGLYPAFAASDWSRSPRDKR